MWFVYRNKTSGAVPRNKYYTIPKIKKNCNSCFIVLIYNLPNRELIHQIAQTFHYRSPRNLVLMLINKAAVYK